MKFTAKTEKQILEDKLNHELKYTLIPDGIYPFRVEEALDRYSQAGNEMIELQLTVLDHEKKQRVLTDYLLEIMDFKLYRFCAATGLLASYESGTLTDIQCVGKTGKVEIGTQKGKDGYKDKNIVKDYVAAPVESNVAEPFKDDIPF